MPVSSRETVRSFRSGRISNASKPASNTLSGTIGFVALAAALAAVVFVGLFTMSRVLPLGRGGTTAPALARQVATIEPISETEIDGCAASARQTSEREAARARADTELPMSMGFAERLSLSAVPISCESGIRPPRYCDAAQRQRMVGLINVYVGVYDSMAQFLAAAGDANARNVAGRTPAAAMAESNMAAIAAERRSIGVYHERVGNAVRALARRGALRIDDFGSFGLAPSDTIVALFAGTQPPPTGCS
jgi:hypothetical protein